jgi:hypothetical protein
MFVISESSGEVLATWESYGCLEVRVIHQSGVVRMQLSGTRSKAPGFNGVFHILAVKSTMN